MDITLSRRLQTDLTTLWVAWTQPEPLRSWLWPFPTTVTIDLRVGGLWRVAAEAPKMAAGGPITILEHEERLELDWRWDGDDHVSHVAILLAPSTDGGVTCDVVHSGNRDEAEATRHEEGWADCLARLVRTFG